MGKKLLDLKRKCKKPLYTECFVLAWLGPWRVKGKSVIAGVALTNHTDLLSLGISL